MPEKRIVISIGGSLIVPDNIDTKFVQEFRELVLEQVEIGSRFVFVTGGGKLARHYIGAASAIRSVENDDMDWLGIHATRMNAHFIRTIFREWAHPRINTNPHDLDDVYSAREPIVVAGGWRPGSSTDYIAVIMASNLGSEAVINLSDTDGVYESDPKKNPLAKRIDRISWDNFRSLVGHEWVPGMSAPFDPVAAQFAQSKGLEVAVMKGLDMGNTKKYLAGESFVGTTISG